MKRDSTAAPPYPGTQAVLRAVAVLKAFTDAHPTRTVAELSRALGLHKTTVFRLLAALEGEGMVARADAAGAYRLGPETVVLGATALRANDLRSVARGELAALSELSGETTTLEVLVGNEVLILDEVLSRYLLRGTPAVGWRGPAHATSTGKVLLAAARHEGDGALARKGVARRRLARLTPKTITSAAQLDRELDDVWRRGYATAVEELEAGWIAVGAGVRDHDGRVAAALSVGGPSSRIPAARITELTAMVCRSAARVSHQLGYRPTPAAAAAPSSSHVPHSGAHA
ncbi:MAG TPA: IclR family transcriptional regulator [Gemmatimonadaceae bacterium]|nr:IclR family transcriptional regulator [Gemmatimonadaceae bacterium]